MVSALSQMVGKSCNAALAGVGLGMFDKGTLTTVFVSILGLICAGTSLGKLPAVEELSNVYLYVVVSLLASTASVSDLLSAPMWVVYGLFILVIHVVLMYLLSRSFTGISAWYQRHRLQTSAVPPPHPSWPLRMTLPMRASVS